MKTKAEAIKAGEELIKKYKLNGWKVNLFSMESDSFAKTITWHFNLILYVGDKSGLEMEYNENQLNASYSSAYKRHPRIRFFWNDREVRVMECTPVTIKTLHRTITKLIDTLADKYNDNCARINNIQTFWGNVKP